MTEKENCNHDWVYKHKGFPVENNNTTPEARQKRICRNCFEMQRQGMGYDNEAEKQQYFKSYFAAPPWENKSAKELVKDWENFK